MTQAPIRHDGRLTVALISEVFWEADGVARLEDRLDEAVRHGADLAVLPEIPLNPWSPATETQRDDDAEPMDGPRATAQAKAAARAGIGLVGGIIHRDATTGRRTQRTLVLDSRGQLVATYEKLHLPDEPGFWEPAHYDAGTAPPTRIDAFGLKVGIQVCSDANRPEGTHLLGGMGAEAVLIPRSTEEATYQRWKTVFQANARTSAMYVLSVNRPYPEQGILIGGPSVAVDPHGTVMIETNDRMAIVTLDRSEVERARTLYPGYLPVRARLYADAWAAIADASEETAITRG
jgi:predicted amidohydrolase